MKENFKKKKKKKKKKIWGDWRSKAKVGKGKLKKKNFAKQRREKLEITKIQTTFATSAMLYFNFFFILLSIINILNNKQ